MKLKSIKVVHQIYIWYKLNVIDNIETRSMKINIKIENVNNALIKGKLLI